MIARLLSKLAAWSLARKPLDPDTQSVKAPPFTGYVIEDNITGAPYMTRVFLPMLGSWRPFLHNIHRADHERDPHNHPWLWSFSIILSGEYDEERMIDEAGTMRKRRVSRFNILTSRDFHRITELHGDVWTLFVHGPRVQTWGFDADGQVIPWRDYIKAQVLAKLDQISGARLVKVARKWFDVDATWISTDASVRATIRNKVGAP